MYKPDEGGTTRFARLSLSDGYWLLDRWDNRTGRWTEYQPGHEPTANLRYNGIARALEIIEADGPSFLGGYQSAPTSNTAGIAEWVNLLSDPLQITVRETPDGIVIEGVDENQQPAFGARLRPEATGWVLDCPRGILGQFAWQPYRLCPDDRGVLHYPNLATAIAVMCTDSCWSFAVDPRLVPPAIMDWRAHCGRPCARHPADKDLDETHRTISFHRRIS